MTYLSDAPPAEVAAGRVVVFHPDDSLWPKLVDAANGARAQPLRCNAPGEFAAMLRVDQPTCGVFEPQSLLASPELLRPLTEDPFSASVIFVGADAAEVGSLLQPTVINALGPAPEQAELRQAIRVGLDAARQRGDDRQLVRDFYERLQTLTPEERGVFEEVCNGKLNKQIARACKVSLRTVEQRRRRVFDKMGVQSAVPLAARRAKVNTLMRLMPGLKRVVE